MIESKRLLLRPVELTDVNEQYQAWMNDPAVMKYTESRFQTHSLEQIRQRAKTHAVKALPAWEFRQDRQEWHYRDAHDKGWPIHGMLEVIPDGADPQMVSPPLLWQAEEAPVLIIEAAFQSGESSATLYWRKLDAPAPGRDDHLTFPVQSDGEFHRYVLCLSECASYKGPMVQLRIDPASKAKADAVVRVKSIRLAREMP